MFESPYGNKPASTYAGFQVRGGAHLKKLRRAEGGANNFGVFRVKNHDFTPKNHIFPILGGAARRVPPVMVFTMLNNLKRDVAIPYRILDHHCINCLF